MSCYLFVQLSNHEYEELGRYFIVYNLHNEKSSHKSALTKKHGKYIYSKYTIHYAKSLICALSLSYISNTAIECTSEYYTLTSSKKWCNFVM